MRHINLDRLGIKNKEFWLNKKKGIEALLESYSEKNVILEKDYNGDNYRVSDYLMECIILGEENEKVDFRNYDALVGYLSKGCQIYEPFLEQTAMVSLYSAASQDEDGFREIFFECYEQLREVSKVNPPRRPDYIPRSYDEIKRRIKLFEDSYESYILILRDSLDNNLPEKHTEDNPISEEEMNNFFAFLNSPSNNSRNFIYLLEGC